MVQPRLLNALLLVLICAASATAQDIPRGVIVDDVKCVADPSQSYALYVPSTYSPEKRWSLLLGVPSGGRTIVEKYRVAAERYGYIVAASNDPHNGPAAVSAATVKALGADVSARFSVDPSRVYLTGHSGGSRAAMAIALSNRNIAGVIASSGGYSAIQPRTKMSFAVFGTAGTEDFNYIEMRMLDRNLTSPHLLAVFPGGHTLPPDDVALEAIEWMELQAMKAGRRTRDDALVAALYEKRMQKIGTASDAAAFESLSGVVADFNGLRDVAAEEKRAKTLEKRPDIKAALADQKELDNREWWLISRFAENERCLQSPAGRSRCLRAMRAVLQTLSGQANAPEESGKRSSARRLLRALTSGAAARTQDREYLALLDEYGYRER